MILSELPYLTFGELETFAGARELTGPARDAATARLTTFGRVMTAARAFETARAALHGQTSKKIESLRSNFDLQSAHVQRYLNSFDAEYERAHLPNGNDIERMIGRAMNAARHGAVPPTSATFLKIAKETVRRVFASRNGYHAVAVIRRLEHESKAFELDAFKLRDFFDLVNSFPLQENIFVEGTHPLSHFNNGASVLEASRWGRPAPAAEPGDAGEALRLEMQTALAAARAELSAAESKRIGDDDLRQKLIRIGSGDHPASFLQIGWTPAFGAAARVIVYD